jgi:hypothetical protein
MGIYQGSINLQIAGFEIRLSSDSLIELELGYEPFISEEVTTKVDVNIECYSGIPTTLFQNDQLVFEARNEEQRFYSIYRTGTDLGFIIYNQQDKDQVQQLAVLDETFSHWKVYSEALPDNKIMPLKYPLGPIIMHYLTLKSDAVMMHASCAFDGSKARVFTGFSGNGKSTMSKLWADAGSLIINDDRLIIRKHGNSYMVYNTPMYYADKPKSAPLSSIHLISHSPENKTRKLGGAMAVSRVMAFCIQNNFDKQFIQSRLRFFSELCLQIPVYDLGFVPDETVVKFILANEA